MLKWNTEKLCVCELISKSVLHAFELQLAETPQLTALLKKTLCSAERGRSSYKHMGFPKPMQTLRQNYGQRSATFPNTLQAATRILRQIVNNEIPWNSMNYEHQDSHLDTSFTTTKQEQMQSKERFD